MSNIKQLKKQISHDIALKAMEWKYRDDSTTAPYFEDQFGKKHRHFSPLDSLENCFLLIFKLKSFFFAGKEGSLILQDANTSEKIENSVKFRYFVVRSICKFYKIRFDIPDSFYKETKLIPSFEEDDNE